MDCGWENPHALAQAGKIEEQHYQSNKPTIFPLSSTLPPPPPPPQD
jgi:hypothetical protein